MVNLLHCVVYVGNTFNSRLVYGFDDMTRAVMHCGMLQYKALIWICSWLGNPEGVEPILLTQEDVR